MYAVVVPKKHSHRHQPLQKHEGQSSELQKAKCQAYWQYVENLIDVGDENWETKKILI